MLKNKNINKLIIVIFAILTSMIYYLPSDWEAKKNTLTITALNERNEASNGNEIWIKEIEVDGKKIPLHRYNSEEWLYKNGELVAYKIIPTIFEDEFNVKDCIKIKLLNHPLSGKIELNWNGQIESYDLYNIQDTEQKLILYPQAEGRINYIKDIGVLIFIVFLLYFVYYGIYKLGGISIKMLGIGIILAQILGYFIINQLIINNLFLILLINIIILFISILLVIKLERVKIKNKKILSPSIIVYNIIFIICMLISVRFEIIMPTITNFGKIFILVGIFIWGIIILSYLEDICLKQYKQTNEHTKKEKINVLKISSILLIATNVIYYFAFFPGFLTSDSTDQWGQMLSYTFYDAHPVAHTLFNLLCTSIWKNPGAVSLVQIIIFVSISIYAISVLLELNIPKRFIYMMVTIYIVSPVFSLMNMTLWKDVMHSNMIFLFTIIMLKLYESDFEWIKKKRNFAIFMLTGLGVLMFRHNGLSAILAVFVMSIILYWKKWKSVIISYSILLISFFVIIGPIYNMFGIESDLLRKRDNELPYDVMTYHTISYILHNDGQISKEDLNELSKIVDINAVIDGYSRYHRSNLLNLEVNEAYLIDHKDKYIDIYKRIVRDNQMQVIENTLNTKSYLWELIHPVDAYLNLAPVNTIYENEYGLVMNPLDNTLNDILTSYFNITSHKPLISIVWRPVLGIFILMLAAIVMIIKYGYKSLIMLVPTMGNWAGIFLTVNFQDFRYMYCIFLVTPFIVAYMLGRKINIKNR